MLIDSSQAERSAAWLDQARALLSVRLALAPDLRRPLVPVGHGSKSWLGGPASPRAEVLSTLDYAGISHYDPTELVVVARAGTPIRDLEALLAQNRQCLAFEPPRFGGVTADLSGTVGGMVASGLSGPRRLAAGPCRDFILGTTVMDGRGQMLRFGGTVMKNVAGYDVSRLHAGAMGRLGILLDVALKVLPVPAAEATVCLALQESIATDLTNHWLGQPLPLAATLWSPQDGGRLWIRLMGAEAAVSSAVARFTQAGAQHPAGELLEASVASALWAGMRDQTDSFFAPRPQTGLRLWRLSLPQTCPPLSLPDVVDCRVEWSGGQRWVWTASDPAALHAAAVALGGHAQLWRALNSQDQAAHCRMEALTPVQRKIHCQLTDELDPDQAFDHGRLLF